MIVSAVQDTLARINPPISKARAISKARGQCYDGASNMSGVKNKVATQLQELEPRVMYTHCYGHALNLAASDTVKSCKVMRVALERTSEICKLMKYSLRREQLFREIKDQIAPGSPGTCIRVLCSTHWTV